MESVKRHWVFLILLTLRYLVPIALTGSIAVRAHDNIDLEIPYNVVIGRFWAGFGDHAVFDIFLGGVLDWYDFSRLLQPLVLLFAVFPPVTAYALTDAFMLVLAYFGFRMLMRVLDLPASMLLASLAAFSLSYPIHGTGLSGAPLMLALLFGSGRVRLRTLLMALFIGLNTALALHALFFPIAALALAIMVGRIPEPHRVLWFGVIYFIGAFLAASGLVFSALFGEASHRTEWGTTLVSQPVLAWAKGTFISLVTMNNFYHAVVTPFLVLPVVLIASFLGPYKNRRAAIVLVTLIAGALAVNVLQPWLRDLLPSAFSSLQLHRFGFFVPILALVLVAMVRSRVVNGAANLTLAIAVLAGMGFNFGGLKQAMPVEAHAVVSALKSGQVSVSAVATALKRITDIQPASIVAKNTWASYVNKAAYKCLRASLALQGGGVSRVLSVGPDPMLAPLNGIAAIDGYHTVYPLTYKKAFRPVIAPLLATSPKIANYFDSWGSRVYSFSDRVTKVLPDFDAAKSLGATYVISDRSLDSADLVLVGTCGSYSLFRIN